MAEASHRVAIVVALIGVAGTLGAALLSNWDKLFGSVPTAGPPPATAVPAAPSSTTPAPPTPAAPIAGPAIDLTGTWRDSSMPASLARIRQVGHSFRFERQGLLADGSAFEASGSGTLDGQQVSSSYQARYGNGALSSGTCAGSVSADATRMDLQCVDSLLGTFASTAVRR